MSEHSYLKKEILPAILPRDFRDMEDKMSQLTSAVKTIQIDVCDGHFVPSRSWPYQNSGTHRPTEADFDKHYLAIINQTEGFPFWEELNFEVDLMVSDLERCASEWISLGAERLIIHIESAPTETVIKTLLDSKDRGVDVGIAIGLNTPIEKAAELVRAHPDVVSVVQCMGIEKIGYQGQQFSEDVYARVKALRSEFPDLAISVDGGVSLDNADALIEAGVTRLVVGSAIFVNNGSVIESIRSFKEIIADSN